MLHLDGIVRGSWGSGIGEVSQRRCVQNEAKAVFCGGVGWIPLFVCFLCFQWFHVEIRGRVEKYGTRIRAAGPTRDLAPLNSISLDWV